MRLSRLLAALALPAALTATACAADYPTLPPSGYQVMPGTVMSSDTQAASLWLRRNSQPAYAPQQICAPYPGVTMPGIQPGAPIQPGQTPGMAPVQTPEAAAAAPQTSAFSQAPAA